MDAINWTDANEMIAFYEAVKAHPRKMAKKFGYRVDTIKWLAEKQLVYSMYRELAESEQYSKAEKWRDLYNRISGLE